MTELRPVLKAISFNCWLGIYARAVTHRVSESVGIIYPFDYTLVQNKSFLKATTDRCIYFVSHIGGGVADGKGDGALPQENIKVGGVHVRLHDKSQCDAK